MFSPNKNNSPLSSSFDQPVFQNHRQIKNVESKYFSEEYNKSINAKLEKQQEQKLKKKLELEQYNKKNEQYLQAVANNRITKLQQKQFMAAQYEEMINYKKMKQFQQKRNQKSYQRDLLGQRSWIRDHSQQRQVNKIKKNRYNQQLEMHVKAQQQRIKQQQQLQKQRRQKINEQAQLIITKQIQELQQRQRRKNMFEQRQNQLLGSYQPNLDNYNSMSSSRVLQQINLRKRQQELYGLGLQIQRQKNEQKKKKQPLEGYNPGQSYNPIINPIPVVYKNPNVLRMLSQK